ncbi:MAG TPA: cytochrome P450 [Pseudonocardiaceae bacterium]|nr:cytochrome P450 [Pseudonocardiaceae bacterium]
MVSVRNRLRTLPPGPPLPGVVQAGLIWVAPVYFLAACHRRYGDRYLVRIPGIGKIVYLADPNDVKSVLRGDPAIFHAGEAAAPLGEILGTRSLILLDDEAHHRRRAMMLPAFHGDSVRQQVAEMVAITADEVARWPVGAAFPVLPRMRAITLEVILRIVIGVHDEARLAALRTALPPLVDVGSPLELIPPPQVLRRFGMWRRRAQRKARAHALLLDEISRCRRDPQLAQRSDVLAMLVRSVDSAGQPMPDDELIDQLVTLLLAGHETTATALAWTFERLTRYPELLKRTAQAARDGHDAWLDAVGKESLRARPVVFEVGRKLTAPIELAGYRIPAGVMLVPSITLVHSSARHYPDPMEFRPQRFVDQRPDPSVWFPFGGGVRRCLGATFAQVEMRTVLREVLRRVELAPTTEPDEQVRVRHVTLVPRQGAVVRVRRHIATAAPPAERTGRDSSPAGPDPPRHGRPATAR